MGRESIQLAELGPAEARSLVTGGEGVKCEHGSYGLWLSRRRGSLGKVFKEGWQ